ncbi:CHAD domain-containing protein [Aliikangiella coralliicola]|uniref:CHAD domain-containing protein n=1 Tax=Aliikangiella coralliicola TaxID=2592383 RepID=A0A545UGC6_9GAMM|nr:CHAD domain-containing protein [Aliikangiella coralliicola]TQV88521.1 CHAD domain-containing protein [Aliikangiella coralliicola]
MKYKWTIFIGLFLLMGCTSKTEQMNRLIEQEVKAAQTSIDSLQKALDSGRLSNAVLLKDYAQQVKAKKPELSSLIDNLALNGQSHGQFVQTLEERLNQVRSSSGATMQQLENNVEELAYIQEAAHIQTFNDALSDPLNVLADLSDGALPRVKSVSREIEKSVNKSESYGAGSQLVGNPQYGNWITGSNGMSFWEWYGMYALFSNLADGRRYSYGRWSQSRPYSYYSDYGRHRYTKPSTRVKQQNLQTKTAKSFRQQGKRFTSPYAKKRTGASQLAKSSQSRPSSGSFRKASTYRSSTSSSSRRSSSRTSRGPRRGK